MPLDNNEREPVPGVTQAEAVKLVQHDDNAFIAPTLSTSEGRSRFIISQDGASQLIETHSGRPQVPQAPSPLSDTSTRPPEQNHA